MNTKFKACVDTERLFCIAILKSLNTDQIARLLHDYLALRDDADKVLAEVKDMPFVLGRKNTD